MQHNSTIKSISFLKIINGKRTGLYNLSNQNGLKASVSNYGARWVEMFVPDKNNNLTDVIISLDNIEAYQKPSAVYYGATIGRYANRIANGTFSLQNKSYLLHTNNGINHLHGGEKGFHNVVWDVTLQNENSIVFKYLSPDGEEGYPGNVETFVTYTLTDNNEMIIEFKAIADQTTIINLTNHAYFNLNENGSIYDHTLLINADNYTPINSHLIPTGNIEPVNNTLFDFRQPKKIGEHINDDNEQLKYGKGFDHNFVLNKRDNKLSLAAIATGDISKIKMEVFTTEPGMQFYTGNFMDGSNTLTNGDTDSFRTAFCLETQHFPDSPNRKNFPATILNPGDTYRSTTLFHFLI